MKLSTKTNQWAKKVSQCSKCDISKLCEHKVPHLLTKPNDTKVDLLFVGEAPGQAEYSLQEPFIGPAGQVLRDIVDELPDISILIVNAIQCTPFTDSLRQTIRIPSLSEVGECSWHVLNLWKITKPAKVVALGKIAEKQLKTLEIPHITVLHPSAILRASKYHYEYQRALLTIRKYLDE